MSHAAAPAVHQVLDLLACPACYGPLQVMSAVVCQQCRRAYPIEDGIPILLIDRATLPD